MSVARHNGPGRMQILELLMANGKMTRRDLTRRLTLFESYNQITSAMMALQRQGFLRRLDEHEPGYSSRPYWEYTGKPFSKSIIGPREVVHVAPSSSQVPRLGAKKKNHGDRKPKARLRQDLEKATQQFLESGNRITEVPTGWDKQPSSTPAAHRRY